MEFNRSDWTALAQQFQHEIFSIAFNNSLDELPELLRKCVSTWNSNLFSGKLNHLLVYRKGISKPLDSYVKNIPPHIRAARKIPGFKDRFIRYVITVEGPEPVMDRDSDLQQIHPDPEHYSQKQLAPIADMLLRFYNTSWDKITSGGEQLSLL